MTTTVSSLPLTDTVQPADQDELIAVVKDAYASDTAIYPIGGGTSLDFGLPARREGIGLSLSRLAGVVDYPASDMTITVDPGITMQALALALADHRQQLPIDVPLPDRATLGGVVATNFNGPRRFGMGTIRDHVIGIHAVDGQGMPFKGGGRVVKNVAGYDFCKLLTGSLGTLGIITQLTVRLKPLAEKSTLLAARMSDLDESERLLDALNCADVTPTAIELLIGPLWREDEALADLADQDLGCPLLVVGLEGTEVETDWMADQLEALYKNQGIEHTKIIDGAEAAGLWCRLADFPVVGESPLVLKANVMPSATTRFMQAAMEVEEDCSIQAHAGNGIVLVKFSQFPADGLSRTLTGKLLPIAAGAQGNVIVLSNPGGAEMTHQSVWGGIDAPFWLMGEVKKRFDPRGILNPGRFVYT